MYVINITEKKKKLRKSILKVKKRQKSVKPEKKMAQIKLRLLIRHSMKQIYS